MALGWRKEYLRYGSYFLNIQNAYKGKEDLRMFLEILLSLATISVFSIFALRPTVLTISELYNEIKTKEKTIIQMDAKIKNLQTIQDILIKEGEVVSLLETSIPTGARPEELTHQLQGLANKDSVNLLSFSVDETNLKGNPVQKTNPSASSLLAGIAPGMGFSLSTSGSYQNLFSLLSDLENLRIPVKIDSFGLNLSKSESGNTLNLVVSGKVPYLERTND
jgi:hypothetical protein